MRFSVIHPTLFGTMFACEPISSICSLIELPILFIHLFLNDVIRKLTANAVFTTFVCVILTLLLFSFCSFWLSVLLSAPLAYYPYNLCFYLLPILPWLLRWLMILYNFEESLTVPSTTSNVCVVL